MNYSAFLFSQLFMNHVENNQTRYTELEYDLIYPEVLKHFSLYSESKYNDYTKGQYECMVDYLKNEVN